jgi:uncharacterized protein (TIGR02453 family)
MGIRYFTPRLFSFLRELAAHNDRDWFAQHNDEYEAHLRERALRFIADAGPVVTAVSPHFVAEASKVGGSLLRIQRDTRFTPDKSPYRTYLGLHFRHEQWKDRATPRIYMALRPRGSYLGVGTWRPDSATAAAIRRAIVSRADVWREAAHSDVFHQTFTLVGDELKRPPRGFDPSHPLIDDLRRKDFAGVSPLTQTDVTSEGFLELFADRCRRATPLLEFLCRATGVPF